MAKRHLKRIITRRKAKWAGLVLCILLAAVFVSSRWVAIAAYGKTSAGVAWSVTVAEGQLGAVRLDISGLQVTRGFFSGSQRQSGGAKKQWSVQYEINNQPRFRWWLEWESYGGPLGSGNGSFSIPLWMPLLLLAIPTAWLWRNDRRIQPWQCRGCRYDLRGLEGGGEEGVCPECGLAIGEE